MIFWQAGNRISNVRADREKRRCRVPPGKKHELSATISSSPSEFSKNRLPLGIST
jgi:hypothetical protein